MAKFIFYQLKLLVGVIGLYVLHFVFALFYRFKSASFSFGL